MLNALDAAGLRKAVSHATATSESLNLLARTEKRELQLVDIISGLKSHGRVTGFASEFLQERALQLGVDHDPHCPTVPWSTVKAQTRAPLAAGLGGTGGGYLVATETEDTV